MGQLGGQGYHIRAGKSRTGAVGTTAGRGGWAVGSRLQGLLV